MNLDAVRALQNGKADAVFVIGPVQSTAVWQALHDTNLKLMSLTRADAYQRRFPYIKRLTLPPGTIDLALHIPAEEVQMIGTKAMLVAHAGLPAVTLREHIGLVRRAVMAKAQPVPAKT